MSDIQFVARRAVRNRHPKSLIHRLKGVRVPRRGVVADVLDRFGDICAVSQRLKEEFAGGPGLAECEGVNFPDSLVGSACDFRVWYVRLPKEWRASLESLPAIEQCCVYIDRDPADPWRVAQWLALLTQPPMGGHLPSHIRVDATAVTLSVYTASKTQAILVFFECEELFGWTAIATDKELYISLQAGNSASSRRPDFDFTKAHLQMLVREIQDGATPAQCPSVLTLPVYKYRRSGASFDELADAAEIAELLPTPVEAFRALRGPVGAIGHLSHIVNFHPAAFNVVEDTVLKLEVPASMWRGFWNEPLLSAVVAFLPQALCWNPSIRVTLRHATHMLEAYVNAADADLASALEGFRLRGRCTLALEDSESGRLHILEIDWPEDCGAFDNGDLHAALSRTAGRLHPDTEKRLESMRRQRDEPAQLILTEVVDAKRWQQIDNDVSCHAVGARGGLVPLLGSTGVQQ